MGANGGASGNKLQTNSNEISIAVATNQVYWSAQKLEVRGHELDAKHREQAGERLTDNVALVARLAFSKIDEFGQPSDRDSLIAKLDDLLSTVKADVAAQKLEVETQSLIETTGTARPQSQLLPPQYQAIEQAYGQSALM